MKKRLFVISMLVVVLLALSASAALAVKPAPVGDQLNLWAGPTEWPANEPFHVTHGFYAGFWIDEPVGNIVALSQMTLEVCDSQGCVDLDADFTKSVHFPPPEYGVNLWLKTFTFNFPDGLPPGEVTFIRHYKFTCQSYLFNGDVLECDHPTELIEDPGMMQTRVVTFVE